MALGLGLGLFGLAAQARVQVTLEPGWFAWSGSYTFSAEVESFERDRFAWELHPDLGRLIRVASGDGSRDTVRYDPPPAGPA